MSRRPPRYWAVVVAWLALGFALQAILPANVWHGAVAVMVGVTLVVPAVRRWHTHRQSPQRVRS